MNVKITKTISLVPSDVKYTIINMEGLYRAACDFRIPINNNTHAICEFCNQPVPFAFCRKVLDVPVCIDCLAKEVQALQNKSTITVDSQTFTIEHVDAGDSNRVLSADFLAKVQKAIAEIKKINNLENNVVIHGPILSVYTTGLENKKEYTCDIEEENGTIITNYI